MSYCVLDLETTTATYMKRKGSPFLMENRIIAMGWQKFGEPIKHEYNVTGIVPSIRPLLEGSKFIVGHNIKFDILYLVLRSQDNLDAWMEYVAAGGLVWDTQLAEFMLNGQLSEDQMLGLNELAPRYGGNAKVDEVKAMWDAGIDTPDIPKQLLIDYLVGRDTEDGWEHGDIGNTEIIFRGQLARAKKQGQMRSIMLNMGSLCATIEMERNGLYADLERGLKLADALSKKLDELRESVKQYLPADLPFEFNWGNRYHTSPLIFGGVTRYKKREWDLADGRKTFRDPASIPEDHPRYKEAMAMYAWGTKDEQHYVLEDGSTIDVDEYDTLVGHEAMPELERYKTGKNAGLPKTKKVKVPDWTKPKTRMAEFEYRFEGYTTPDEKWASSTEGLYSVAGDVIEELGVRDIPFLKVLAEIQKLDKDLGTYYITDDGKGGKKGMLALVGEDGIIHHKLNHTSVVTLRFSSSDPNMQNIPTGKRSDVKTVLRSRWGDDGLIGQDDFTSLEVYIQAIITDCKKLIEALQKGLDMHCLRVSQVPDWAKGRTYEQIYALHKAEDEEIGALRSGAKGFSFQRAYGAGKAAIAASTGISEDDVQALIDAEESEYPEIKEYFDKMALTLEASRIDIGRYVAHPQAPHITCNLGRAYSRTPDGKLYSFHESPAPEFVLKRGTVANFKPTEIKNYKVQGGGGEHAKAAMWLAVRAFYATKNYDHLALLINQVHDALYTDSHKKVAKQANAMLHACMVEASTFMEWFFKWEQPVHVPAEFSAGPSMAEEISPCKLGWDDFDDLVKANRQHIRDTYMQGYVPVYNTLH